MKIRRFLRGFVGLSIVAAINAPASAYDWAISTKVTMVEVTYMPTSLDFSVDHAGGSCAAGSLLTWTPQGPDATSKAQNAQAVLSVLMTAKSTGQNVMLYGNNSGCQINFIYHQ